MKSRPEGIEVSCYCQHINRVMNLLFMLQFNGEAMKRIFIFFMFVVFNICHFITGFLLDDGKSQFGRLAGLAQYFDGTILLSDNTNGVIYRVSYNMITSKE